MTISPSPSRSDLRHTHTLATDVTQSPTFAPVGDNFQIRSAEQSVEKFDILPSTPCTTEEESVPVISQRRKYALLFLFSLGMFMDVLGFSVFFILVGPVGEDLNITVQQQTWVIVTFASFLLFWGRVADIFSPKPVFTWGLLGLGLCNLIISFLPNAFSFYVLRAISGLCGSCLIPAAFRLIVNVFAPEELSFAFTVYGVSGSVSNSMGILLGGIVQLIPGTGQMIAWRWYFRISAAIIVPAAAVSMFLIPKQHAHHTEHKLKSMDLIGSITMFSSSLLLILALTLGAAGSFTRPAFYVPLVLSFVLLAIFVVWEAKADQRFVLLPMSIWSNKNFGLWIVLSLLAYAWFSMDYIPFAELFQHVHSESPIVTSARIVPQGISSTTAAIVLIMFPKLSARPRVPMFIGLVLGMIAYLLWIHSGTQVGTDYWRYVFPGMIIGSIGMHTYCNCCNVGAMAAIPSHQAGVAGAVLQTSMQVGSAIAISIQAGLLTVHPNSYEDFRNVQVSWWFVFGWTAAFTMLFGAFYRQPSNTNSIVPMAAH